METAWTVLGSSIGFVGATAYVINIARKWVFWWSSILNIAVVLLTQIVMLCVFAPNTTLSATRFNTGTSAAMLLVQLIISAVAITEQPLKD